MNSAKQIPKGWIETTLGEVSDKIFSGGTPNTKQDNFWNGKFSWLSSGETGQKNIYRTKKSITQAGIDNSSTRLAKKGYVVMATAGQGNTRGQVSFLHIDTYINQSIISISGKNNMLDNRWLFNNLSNRYSELRALSESNSVRGSITTSMLKSYFHLLLPSLPEQKAIAKILTSFDDKIENLQVQNKTLEQTAQTIFKEWFGKYQIGDKLPEKWKILSIDELVEVIIDYRGKTPKKLGMDWSESGIPALSAKTIKKGKIVRRDAMNFGSPELYKIWMKDELQKGDILLTSEAPLGEMYYINDDKKYILSQRLFALRVNENITSQYLYHYLFSRYGQHLLQARASGSTVEGIRQSELRKIEIIIPDKDSLEKASYLFQNVFDKKHNNSKQIQSLKETRNELLPKLMSGEIRIKEFIK